MEDISFVLEGYQTELSLTGGIDYSWNVLPSFEELKVRGHFVGSADITEGGEDFTGGDRLAASIGFDKKVGSASAVRRPSAVCRPPSGPGFSRAGGGGTLLCLGLWFQIFKRY